VKKEDSGGESPLQNLPALKETPLLVEGEDYYLEGGFMVFTEKYLRSRGYCCDSGCRHCPYKEGENR
jgi:hypothetical protein